MKKTLAFIALALAAAPAFADVPNACEIIKVEEINTIANGTVEKVQLQKAGNPSVCGFMDSRRGAVLVLSIREVQYAVENELQLERENLEKIYKGRVKWLHRQHRRERLLDAGQQAAHVPQGQEDRYRHVLARAQPQRSGQRADRPHGGNRASSVKLEPGGLSLAGLAAFAKSRDKVTLDASDARAPAVRRRCGAPHGGRRQGRLRHQHRLRQARQYSHRRRRAGAAAAKPRPPRTA
jgi:hypothetical protein